MASLKPSAPGEPRSGQFKRQGDRWAEQASPLLAIVSYAFQISLQRIEGLSATQRSARYDIDARMPQATTDAEFHLMLQTLLADRFHMTWHTEMRPTDVSILTAGAPGPDLHQASGHCLAAGAVAPPGADQGVCGIVRIVTMSSNGIEIAGNSVTMANLADFFKVVGIHPVLDESGSSARYDFDITLTPPPSVEGESPEVHEFEALKSMQSQLHKELGIQLDMTHTVKRPMPVLVIDHIEPATAN
ncbi:MAG TPA: TIGR03435 family protein [Terriglobales bacterium]